MNNKLIIAICILGCLFSGPALVYSSEQTIDVVVNKTERVRSGQSDTYLVFTENETFQNSDSLLYGKFNSSDFHGRLKDGQKYRLTIVGWRVSFLSWYRNVVRMEEL